MSEQHLQINISFAAEHKVLLSKGNESGRDTMHEEHEEFSLLSPQMKKPLWLQVTITHNSNWKAKPKGNTGWSLCSLRRRNGDFCYQLGRVENCTLPFLLFIHIPSSLGVLDIASKTSLLWSWKGNVLPCALQRIKYHQVLLDLTKKAQVCIPCWKCILLCHVIFGDVMLPNTGRPDRYLCSKYNYTS